VRSRQNQNGIRIMVRWRREEEKKRGREENRREEKNRSDKR
jgi:hypothetical protein